MKIIKIVSVIMFLVMICLPVAFFNFTENAISEIDNRKLAGNPFSADNEGTDITEAVENYVNDRIGFRSDMILSYTVLNDKLFNKMVHPSYRYGKDGYVFANGLTTEKNKYTDYHQSFADMVEKIKLYCDERNIPFLFVFNPAKPAVMTEHVPVGMNYSREWAEELLTELEERGISVLDNTVVLREKYLDGEMVFNQKYDANHWNDMGSFYGTNAIIERLKASFSTLKINRLEEMKCESLLQTSLPLSKFPINEYVPQITPPNSGTKTLTDLYKSELKMDYNYRTFNYFSNDTNIKNGAPSVLMFQGSYMNVKGYKYLCGAFGEYIAVHDYQNVINFDYYYNIFKPDCVVFEVAEYTINETYFSRNKMDSIHYNPTLESKLTNCDKLYIELDKADLEIKQGKTLTEIVWKSEVFEYVWIDLNEEFDMYRTEDGYTATVLTEKYEEYKDSIRIFAYKNKSTAVYQ